jgi:putative ABC transport system permease protein
MGAYYLRLALRALRNSPVLTALMVLALAVGIGASMTMLTVLHVLSGDPLPGRSAHLYYPQVDPRPLARNGDGNPQPPGLLTYIDAENLLHQGKAARAAVMYQGADVVQPPAGSVLHPFVVTSRLTGRDFFSMFEVPFRYGAPWSAADDAGAAHVAVISQSLDRKLFGGADSVGRMLNYGGHSFRIVGVLAHWRPVPRFYDLNSSRYGEIEDVFIPFNTARALDIGVNGTTNCFGQTTGNLDTSPCGYIQMWVQLDSAHAAAAYKRFLVDYSAQQHAAGRFQRKPNVRLDDLMQWLATNHVVPEDVRMQAWLALGFLLVCVVNTVGLLLAKFLRRSGEIGVRRALGASRRAIFAQLLIEAGMIGAAGALLGLLLTWLGLWLVRRQPSDYASLAHLEPSMLLATLALALIASLVAGLLPAWRACLIAPALQLKSS